MKTLEQLAREAGAASVVGGGLYLSGEDALDRFRAACRTEALEEAAKKCEARVQAGRGTLGRQVEALECAAAIREMK